MKLVNYLCAIFVVHWYTFMYIHNICSLIGSPTMEHQHMYCTLQSIELEIILAFVIALHNIPEGIAVTVPVYTSTNSRKKAISWSFLSGVSEPVGALIVGLILYPFINDFLLGAMLAIVGGFMIYISLDELLPAS